METDDEVVERQKKTCPKRYRDRRRTNKSSYKCTTKCPKISSYSCLARCGNKLKSLSSGETTWSQNSVSCSIEHATSDRGLQPARATYVNERRQKQDESRFDFKNKPRKFPKDSNCLTWNPNNSDRFDERPLKHHSFVSEVSDVKHMERALLGCLMTFILEN